MARFTRAESSADQVEALPALEACKNLCVAIGFMLAESSTALTSSKPLRRMKFSRVRAPRLSSCASNQGVSLMLDWRRDHESRSLLKTAPPATVLSGGASWCLESTSMAAFKFSSACTLSFSMPWNSDSCFSRSAVASASACLSEAIWAVSSLMLVSSSELLAVIPSMSEASCSIFAVDALIASSFSYLPVLHQHSSSLKSASSSSWSFSSVADISFNKFTTRVIGVSLPLSKDFSQTRCKEPPAEPAAEPAAAAPASKVPKTTMCNMVLAS
mmetsp:Transcript_81159/g.262288  ORF Transcript_81159/g.262288 Transcript_81159/m.262288 type:complete len:272 (-) Transcript_81159:43-858(-)